MPEVQQGTATGILFYEARKLELEAVAAAMIVMVTATHVGRKTRCAVEALMCALLLLLLLLPPLLLVLLLVLLLLFYYHCHDYSCYSQS